MSKLELGLLLTFIILLAFGLAGVLFINYMEKKGKIERTKQG
jgi:hypothetical protein